MEFYRSTKIMVSRLSQTSCLEFNTGSCFLWHLCEKVLLTVCWLCLHHWPYHFGSIHRCFSMNNLLTHWIFIHSKSISWAHEHTVCKAELGVILNKKGFSVAAECLLLHSRKSRALACLEKEHLAQSSW